MHQAGLFLIDGYNQEQFEAIVGSFCPATLFPFARVKRSRTSVSRGGFPEFVLQPINFDALFAEGKRRAAESAAPADGEGAPEISH